MSDIKMKKIGFITLFALVFMTSVNARAQQFTTSLGFVLTSTDYKNFPNAWRTPDGTVWTNIKRKKLSREAAAQACSNAGGRLPTVDDCHRLKQYFDYKRSRGHRELGFIFPPLRGRPNSGRMTEFWTSSDDDFTLNGEKGWGVLFEASSGHGIWGPIKNHARVMCVSN